MDDLQLLREIRSDVDTVEDATLARGRHNLMARIGGETTGTAVSRKMPRRTMLRRGFLVGAAAAVLVGGIVVADVVSVGGKAGATAEAAEVLNNAAAATILTSDPVVGPGQFLKIDTFAQYRSSVVDASGQESTWLDLMTDEMYIPANRNDEWFWNRSARVPTTFFDEASKEKALTDYAAITHQSGRTVEFLRGANGNFYGSPAEDVAATEASLPRDPRALLDAIYLKVGTKGASPDGQVLVFIADLLRTGQVKAEMRAALYKAAALIPGITIAEQQATLNGQTGIAIGRVEAKRKYRQDIIIDPTTGLMIGERQVTIEQDGPIPAGTATGWTSVKTSVVDSAP